MEEQKKATRQTSKTRQTAASDAPDKKSPATPRSSSSRISKSRASDSDSAGNAARKNSAEKRNSAEKSPRVSGRRSPRRSPAAVEKKRSSKLPEMELQISQLQEDLEKAKEQLNSSELLKQRALVEAEEWKKQLQEMSVKFEDSKVQLVEFSTAEELRLQELRKISQDRDLTWRSELEAVQKQQMDDREALEAAMSEVERLKHQLEVAVKSEAVHLGQLEDAKAEIQDAKQEMATALDTVEKLKSHVRDAVKSEDEAREMLTERERQLDSTKATIETLLSEGLRLKKSLDEKIAELEGCRSQVKSLEETVDGLQARVASGEKKHSEKANAFDPFEAEVAELRSLLTAAEKKHAEEELQSAAKIRLAHEMLENVKVEYESKVFELEVELGSIKSELAKVKDLVAERDLSSSMFVADETELSELKTCLLDKETALQGIVEENETLKLELRTTELESEKKYAAAIAELELVKAAEQDMRARLGIAADEANKSNAMATRAAQQLDAVQTMNSEMESELKRLRIQSDQWRKAAEAAAAALSGNNGRSVAGMERTGSMDTDYNSIGGKLASSPFSDDFDDESPKRKSNGVLRRMSGLWKKTPK